VRSAVTADEFSDLDLIIASSDTEKWFSGEYPKRLGDVSISFIEPTLGGGKERRCIYDDDKDVDMIIFTPQQLESAFKDGAAQWVMDRGYMFLYDADSFAELAKKYVSPVTDRPPMSSGEFENIVNDFYFHNIWAAKKLLRGEIWSAKMCIDSYLKARLLKIIEQYHSDKDVWHDGRFIDKWADAQTLDELTRCFAHYDKNDCAAALAATHKLFARLSNAVAEKRGFACPHKAQACAARYLEKLARA
jgi:aminoglycoside 6-adenylyltransferase